MRFSTLITELRRRRVFRAAGVFIVAAWVAVQVASLVFPAIEVPENALLYVWLVALFLFPLFVVFAWFYDITSTGIARTEPARSADAFDPSLRRSDYLLLAALTIVAVAITLEFTSRIEGSIDPGDATINPFSIAVLPLDNIAGDPDQQYFVSGMQGALIAGLSRIRALRVTSKTSTLQYRDAGVSLDEIGRQLGVARIIEGQVYRSGNRVRIAVQLLDAMADEHIWSATFEDRLENIMLLQSRIAQEIAGQVRVVLTPDVQTQFETAQSVNADAYDAFLKGVFHVERFTPEDMQAAAGYFQQVVDIDPDYALGYWGLGKLCVFQAQAGLLTPDDARAQCLPLMLKALDIDPFLPEAHLGYGGTLTWQHFDWAAARPAFERAIELNPSYAEAHMFFSHYLGVLGELDASSEHMRIALELDPMNPFVKALSGIQLVMIDQFEDAVLVSDQVLQSTPGFGFGYVTLFLAHHYLGNKEASLRAFANFLRHTFGKPDAADIVEALYAELGYEQALLQFADILIEQSKSEHVPPMTIGSLYEHGGDVERAIDWYEIAYQRSDPDAPYIGVNSKTPEINAHPRFQQLLRDMQLDYWADNYARDYAR